MLCDEDKVADLGLLHRQTLLVQLPGTSRFSAIVGRVLIQVIAEDNPVGALITKDVDPEYKYCFLKAHTKGDFTEDDVELNDISDADNDQAPKFVKDHEDILSRK